MTSNGIRHLTRVRLIPLTRRVEWYKRLNHTFPVQRRRNTTFSISNSQHSSKIVKSPFKDIEIPNKLITEMVWDTVDKYPDYMSMKCGITGRAYTFAEVQKQSYRFANSLRKAGFSPGEVIAVVSPNSPEYAIITLGALEAGLSVSFINQNYTSDEISHQLQDSGSVCVVAVIELMDTVFSAISKVEMKTQSKPFRRVIAIDIPSPQYLPAGVVRLSEMVATDVDSTPKSEQVQPSSVACLFYSSGTTGLPKGVCLSHKNIGANLMQLASLPGLQVKGGVNQDVLLGLLPFYHVYGMVTILLGSLCQGGRTVTLPKFVADSFVNALENEKITILILVPPLLLFVGESDKVVPKHFEHLTLSLCGAAPAGHSDWENFRTKLPCGHSCNMMQGYGMTELSPVAMTPPLPVRNLDTIGVPVPNTSAKIINPDTGDLLGINEPGELCIKGPQVMIGYHNNPKATSDMIDSEGWLRTGDLAYYDEDKHFYIKDRLKELIKVKGLQVAPAELEEVLRSHVSISDAGVIGVPCPKKGEKPIAYVVLKKHKKLTSDDIKHFLSEKLSRHKNVAEVFFVESIPKSAAGKILRKDLKKVYNTEHSVV